MNKTQIELIEELLTLAKKNPDKRIIFCVDNNEVCDPDWYQYSLHQIDKVVTDRIMYVETGESVITGMHEIRKYIEDYVENFPELVRGELSIEEIIDRHSEEVIFVYTQAIVTFL